MGKLIGYARVSTRAQDTDRQITGLLGAGVRRDDLYTDQGDGGARASRPGFDKALQALQTGDPPPTCRILPKLFGSAESGYGR